MLNRYKPPAAGRSRVTVIFPMPSSVGAWTYHNVINNTPMIPTTAKIANWIRTNRVNIYEPPVFAVAPGTGATWSAGDAGAAGATGPVGNGAF